MFRKSLTVMIAAGGLLPAFAAEPNPAAQPLTPTQVEEAGEKVQKIIVHVSIESKNSLDLNTVRNNVKLVRF